jgi:3-deoxy-D-manno-octulosonate 8-phosphate phosphatase (KDO 8-P phosphatase)
LTIDMDEALKEKLGKIKLLTTDFDGVMTDGCVYVDENGKETVKCSRKDSWGTKLLQENGIEAYVVSYEVSPVVGARCKKIKVGYFQAVERGMGKLDIIADLAKKRGFSLEEVAYIGDDINDIPALQGVGVAMTVADGHPLVLEICHLVTKAKGGEHAVREISEMILAAKDIPLT